MTHRWMMVLLMVFACSCGGGGSEGGSDAVGNIVQVPDETSGLPAFDVSDTQTLQEHVWAILTDADDPFGYTLDSGKNVNLSPASLIQKVNGLKKTARNVSEAITALCEGNNYHRDYENAAAQGQNGVATVNGYLDVKVISPDEANIVSNLNAGLDHYTSFTSPHLPELTGSVSLLESYTISNLTTGFASICAGGENADVSLSETESYKGSLVITGEYAANMTFEMTTATIFIGDDLQALRSAYVMFESGGKQAECVLDWRYDNGRESGTQDIKCELI